ncbi:hypothetical protein EW026_g4211 [Hermanssonia centrifuga]|uniref:Flavin-containing monooxygenase n=1 Tax=Hermanssonia centrifuga TaxID=98765 RepID=A0A4V3XAE8_9APHY|nr:hypothetical protein EW026_g4211 [Hermanssonia centrifuga]
MSVPNEQTNIASKWLSEYSSALLSGDPQAVASTFVPGGWLRDVLTFTWDNRSLEGREKISSYLTDRLQRTQISHITLSKDPYFHPSYLPTGTGLDGDLEAGFVFETPVAYGKGYMRLVPDKDGEWKALIVSMVLADFKGHEEMPGRENFEDVAQNRSWGEMEADRRARIESNPHVVIIGGGQTGLHVAARFKQMGIPALIIERRQRIGDNWRCRYDSLALHTIREQHQLLYQPHPSTWPIFTPRDKVADMLESQERKVWTLIVDHAGEQVEMHPVHVVLATGTPGDPYTPTLENRDRFTGTAIHATQYMNPKIFLGKDVIVVGAGNSSIDICQDLATNGAKSVTMVQRSSTCVVSRKHVAQGLSSIWQQGVPVEVGDFKFASTPFGFSKKMMINRVQESWAEETELHDKLRMGGLKINMGPEGQGQFLLVFERGGGYWMDKGGADLIASGDIKVKQGVAPKSFGEKSLVFEDESELPADAVIFATGYINIRETNKKLFGADIIDQTSHVWGLDDEGELRGSYRPSGHPGLWYATGDFYNSRFQSKQLALLIKAIDIGLLKTY